MIEMLEELVGAPVALEQLKLKPGRRRTLRAVGPGGTAIVKLYASGRASVVAQRVGSLAGGPDEPLVPAVLHVDVDAHLVVLSEVPGPPLREALLTGDPATCARVGAALGAWHAAWWDAAPAPLRPHTAGRELAVLRARAAGSSPAVSQAVHAALPPLSGEWPSTTVVHRDLYEEQILAGEPVGLIDLDDAAVGPPELDLGNLCAHVELLAMRSGRDLARETSALVDGYTVTGPEIDPELLERCRRLTLLRLACLNDEVPIVEHALGNEKVLG